MTDNEIIKALECCVESECEGCKYEYDTACKEYILHDCIRLIKQKQDEVKAYKHYYDECLKDLKRANAEIDRLKDAVADHEYANCVAVKNGLIYTYTLDDYDRLIGDISAEAIKEFAKMLIDKSQNGVIAICDLPDYVLEFLYAEAMAGDDK